MNRLDDHGVGELLMIEGRLMPAGGICPARSVAQALQRWRAGGRAEPLRTELLQVLASVPDPRDRRGRRYPLAALLGIAILAVAAGMRGYAGFASWAATEVLPSL